MEMKGNIIDGLVQDCSNSIANGVTAVLYHAIMMIVFQYKEATLPVRKFPL